MATIRFHELDVRAMLAAGTEPLPAIRAAVDALKPGHGLTVVAPFLPAPLIEKLKSEGFAARLDRGKAGAWTVNFWRD